MRDQSRVASLSDFVTHTPDLPGGQETEYLLCVLRVQGQEEKGQGEIRLLALCCWEYKLLRCRIVSTSAGSFSPVPGNVNNSQNSSDTVIK